MILMETISVCCALALAKENIRRVPSSDHEDKSYFTREYGKYKRNTLTTSAIYVL